MFPEVKNGNHLQDKLLRLPQLMEVLGIGRSTVWKWLKAGYLPPGFLFEPSRARVVGFGHRSLH